jgi:hypothetical protein
VLGCMFLRFVSVRQEGSVVRRDEDIVSRLDSSK